MSHVHVRKPKSLSVLALLTAAVLALVGLLTPVTPASANTDPAEYEISGTIELPAGYEDFDVSSLQVELDSYDYPSGVHTRVAVADVVKTGGQISFDFPNLDGQASYLTVHFADSSATFGDGFLLTGSGSLIDWGSSSWISYGSSDLVIRPALSSSGGDGDPSPSDPPVVGNYDISGTIELPGSVDTYDVADYSVEVYVMDGSVTPYLKTVPVVSDLSFSVDGLDSSGWYSLRFVDDSKVLGAGWYNGDGSVTNWSSSPWLSGSGYFSSLPLSPKLAGTIEGDVVLPEGSSVTSSDLSVVAYDDLDYFYYESSSVQIPGTVNADFSFTIPGLDPDGNYKVKLVDGSGTVAGGYWRTNNTVLDPSWSASDGTYNVGTGTRLQLLTTTGAVTPPVVTPPVVEEPNEPVVQQPTPGLSVSGGGYRVGDTLTPVHADWVAQGYSVEYRWYSNLGYVNHRGHTKDLTLIPGDEDKTYRIWVILRKAGQPDIGIWSDPTPVIQKGLLQATPTPRISGKVQVGSKLTANPGAWDAGVSVSYQWLAGGRVISGATGREHTVRAADSGKRITVRVTGTKPSYESVSKTSAATGTVKTAKLSKTPTPKVKGTAKVSRTLRVTTGKWDSGVKLTYQWRTNGKAIKGATKSSYKLKRGDRGKTITVSVKGTKSGYTSVTKTSKKTKRVAR